MFPTWYRFQITSALSILHRLTGIALAVGSILLAWWLVAVAAGGELFDTTHAFIASPIGLLLLFGWSIAFFYHLCNGIRHLAWDAGYGFRSAVPIAAVMPFLLHGRDRSRLSRVSLRSHIKTFVSSNTTALRDETVSSSALGSARDGLKMAVATPDRNRADPLILRRLGAVACHVRPHQRPPGSPRRSGAAHDAVVLAGLAHALSACARSSYVPRARLVAAGLLIRAAVILAGASVLAVLKLFLGR